MTKAEEAVGKRGALLLPLVIGEGPLHHACVKIYHTSRVVALHDQ